MSTYTVCFCGTECWPDEGIKDRSASGGTNPVVYGRAGYLPVKIFNEIRSPQRKTLIGGPGKPYDNLRRWLNVPSTVLAWAPVTMLDQGFGLSMWDIAGHAAARIIGLTSSGRGPRDPSLAEDAELMSHIAGARDRLGVDLSPLNQGKPPSNHPYLFSPAEIATLQDKVYLRNEDTTIRTINLIGHSRGAVAAIMCSHELAYLFPTARVNIFAIDPVPGGMKVLAKEMMTLGPTVNNFVGVYALDDVSNGFNGVVPWPYHGTTQIDPLKKATQASPAFNVNNYHLIAVPGRHSTIAGNMTKKGDTDVNNLSTEAEMVGLLVDALARACLRRWGTAIDPSPRDLDTMQTSMSMFAPFYRGMRATTYPTGPVPFDLRERGITSSDSILGTDWTYLEDAIGGQPLVTRSRGTDGGAGQVRWQTIQEVPDFVFERDTPQDANVDMNFFQLVED